MQDEGRIDRERWRRMAGTFSRFAAMQVVVQAIGAMVGILIVRALDKDQYALFTVASSLQATANLLSDCGINAGLLSVGGRIWSEPGPMGSLVEASMRLRRRLTLTAALVVSPLSFYLLARNGASAATAAILTVLVIASLQMIGASTVYAAVLKLNGRHAPLQAIDAAAAVTRLAGIGVASLARLNAVAATAIGCVAYLVQYVASRKTATAFYDERATPEPAHQRRLAQLVRGNFAFSAYTAIQGQIAVFILGFAGTISQVADVGALMRLGVVASIIGTFLNYVGSPTFARAPSRARLQQALAASLLGVTLVSVVLIAGCHIFSQQILWIFGPQYSHLGRELVLVALALSLNLYLSVLWTVNTARAWLKGTWILIPSTIGLQLALAQVLDLTSLNGILWFSILSQAPNLAWSAGLTWHGYRRWFDEATATPASVLSP
jgi:O-antigen/teichoic acid export membrane protein